MTAATCGFVLCIVTFSGVFSYGVSSENKRIYNQCMVELSDKPHKEVVETCKERVK